MTPPSGPVHTERSTLAACITQGAGASALTAKGAPCRARRPAASGRTTDSHARVAADRIRVATVAHARRTACGRIDRAAYTMCALEGLRDALRRRDVYVTPSERYADARAILLGDAAWDASREDAQRSLSLPAPPGPFLQQLGGELDEACQRTREGLTPEHDPRTRRRRGYASSSSTRSPNLPPSRPRERVDALLCGWTWKPDAQRRVRRCAGSDNNRGLPRPERGEPRSQLAADELLCQTGGTIPSEARSASTWGAMPLMAPRMMPMTESIKPMRTLRFLKGRRVGKVGYRASRRTYSSNRKQAIFYENPIEG